MGFVSEYWDDFDLGSSGDVEDYDFLFGGAGYEGSVVNVDDIGWFVTVR